MSYDVDFSTLKKKFLSLKLADGTILFIRMPKKGLLKQFMTLQNEIADGDNTDQATDEVYDVCAKIMSCNKTGKVITPEYVGELFDLEDVYVFFNAYANFVSTISSAKN